MDTSFYNQSASSLMFVKRCLGTLSILILCAVALTGCGQPQRISFNSEKWKTKDDVVYPYRNQMIDDLATHLQLKNKTVKEVKELLGEPDFVGDKEIGYDVVVEYGRDIDPVHVKRLVLKLSDVLSDSAIIKDVSVEEWRK